MTNVTFADIEYQIKHLPTDKLPIVYQFIRSLSDTADHQSDIISQEQVYDFTKTTLWKMRSSAHAIEEDAEGTSQKGVRKKTNYADTIDEVVYGVSLSQGNNNDEENSC